MIYRRESPSTPSRRFKSIILNPVGTKITKKAFYKYNQLLVGRHNGMKVCLRRKKSIYKTKLNLAYTSYNTQPGVISSISISRRYKTFAGLLTYSNGAMNCVPLFSGAYISSVVQVWPYFKSPKIHLFSRFTTGSIVPIAYLPLMTCLFNIMYTRTHSAWFGRAGGTFCILIRINAERGYCTVKIPSAKYKAVNETSFVTLGRNSNMLPKGIWIGKAGININKGFRPSVRGVAKNPVDHPHGGRTKSNSPERTPWGKIAKFNK